MDQDGNVDIAVGMPLYAHASDSVVNAGAVIVAPMDSSVHPISSKRYILDHYQGNLIDFGVAGRFIGWKSCGVGDLDGDGVPEIALGDRSYNGNTGRLLVYFLRSDGTAKKIVSLESSKNGVPAIPGSSFFGHDCDSLGDLNGDGIPDLVVGAHILGSYSYGGAYVLFLSSDGFVTAYDVYDVSNLVPATSTYGHAGLSNTDGVGHAVAYLGDLDGDGLHEIALGSMYDDTGGTDNGAILIVHVTRSGALVSWHRIAQNMAGFDYTFPVTGGRFGNNLRSPGDIDGDGVNDLVTSASINGYGGLFVLFLNPDATVKSFRLVDSADGARKDKLGIGHSLVSLAPSGAGDLDGDGVPDLLLGISGLNAGEGGFALALMNRDGTIREYQEFDSSHPLLRSVARSGIAFGAKVELVDDIDGDGMGEVQITAHGDSEAGVNHGATFLVSLKKLLEGMTPGSDMASTIFHTCRIPKSVLKVSRWRLG